MKNTLALVYGISMALLVSGYDGAAQGERSGDIPSPDREFTENAVQGGQTEVQLGQLASERATDPAVRDFGARMVQDHQNANVELTRILAEKGINEPSPMAEATRMSEHLQNLNGADFDRAYMKGVIKDHKKDIASFKNEAANGKDPEIRAWAAQTLPTLEEHLQIAERTQAAIPK